ncbi:MAG: hypothetical protein AAFQ82_08795 [Myxococcota bacterium]
MRRRPPYLRIVRKRGASARPQDPAGTAEARENEDELFELEVLLDLERERGLLYRSGIALAGIGFALLVREWLFILL